MIALRNMFATFGLHVSSYGLKTFYIGQQSSSRTVCVYRKAVEVFRTGHEMPMNVYGRKHLLKSVVGLVRMELRFRRGELARLGLSNPANWSDGTVQQLFQPWVNGLGRTGVQVPNVELAAKLTAAMQARFYAWVLGDLLAFERGGNRAAFLRRYRTVKKATGFDVSGPPDLQRQADVFVTVGHLIASGVAFHPHDKQWPDLLKGKKAR